ncbi:MAG: nuclear export factor [Ilumatobacteraceae bacterium]|nr:nuclear export factor [Ilumatobacteraceae bacterium]
MNRSIRKTTGAALGATCVAVLLGAGAASAHIAASPPAIEAGKPATVSFDVEHGCNGSNTTTLEFKQPDGVTDAKAVDKTGWTTAAANGTITFSGGNLDAKTPDEFSIAFTAPTTPGTIYFPVVQTCATGETAWIEIAAAGAPEPDHPAPMVLVTAGPPTSDELTVPVDDDADATATTDAAASVTIGGATTDGSTVSSPVSSTPGTTAATTATTVAPSTSSGDSSNTGLVVGIIIGVIVVIGGAVLLARRGKGSTA